MDNNLIKPILDRIASGDSKEDIKREVLSHGYSEQEFERAYSSAVSLGISSSNSSDEVQMGGGEVDDGQATVRVFGVRQAAIFSFFYTVIVTFIGFVVFSSSYSLMLYGDMLNIDYGRYLRSFILRVDFIAAALLVAAIVQKSASNLKQLIIPVVIAVGAWLIGSLIVLREYITLIFYNPIEVVVKFTWLFAFVLIGLGVRYILEVRSVFVKLLLLLLPVIIMASTAVLLISKSETISIDDCGGFSGLGEQAFCFREIAVRTNDLDLCYEIGNVSLPGDSERVVGRSVHAGIENKCSREVVDNLTKDGNLTSDYCGFLEKENARAFCFWRTAVAEKDLDLCHKVTKDYIVDACTAEVGRDFIDNISQCDLITDTFGRNTCIKRMVVQKNDVSLCDNASEDSAWDRRQCISDFARASGDISICENELIDSINEAAWARSVPEYGDDGLTVEDDPGNMISYCYKGVAVTTNDRSVCEKIISPEFKASCFRDVQ